MVQTVSSKYLYQTLSDPNVSVDTNVILLQKRDFIFWTCPMVFFAIDIQIEIGLQMVWDIRVVKASKVVSLMTCLEHVPFLTNCRLGVLETP